MMRFLTLFLEVLLVAVGLVLILIFLDVRLGPLSPVTWLPVAARAWIVSLKPGLIPALVFGVLAILRTGLYLATGSPAAGQKGVPAAPDLSTLDPEDPRSFEVVRGAIENRSSGSKVEIIDLVDQLLVAASSLGASDVHLEPKGKTVRIVFRIDGILRDVAQLPKQIEHAVVNRLKVASNLDISKTDTPQDGRVQAQVAGRAMNLRVSIFPTLHGEKVVVRILDSKRTLPRLDEFGIQEEVLREFRRLLRAPQGMILVTGPTGSGKTTLMYACLREIQEGDAGRRNIVTLEDPIEQELEDINQSQVDQKRNLTFATGLRTLLRQDPDIIMVGEIRDLETAKIALQAGQTGHLILSTVHASSSAAAFGRVIELGIEPFLLASAVSGVVAQRLVRKLCPACRVRKDPPHALLEQIGIPPGSGARFYESPGCPECANTGYVGRLAIFELLRMNEHVADAVLRRASAADVLKAARSRGMITLLEDGLVKVQEGQTSLVELLRVVQ